jgi:HAMP domain-containing protein
VFSERFANYAVAVFILMLAMLGASQLLIRFLLSQLNTLKDVMLHVEKTGDLSARVPLACSDEVGQMANAFNAMQAGYQRVVNTVANTARQLDDGAARLASSMNDVRQGMLGQQSETDQAATAINEMTATVYHIAQHAGATRDLSQPPTPWPAAGSKWSARAEVDCRVVQRRAADRRNDSASGRGQPEDQWRGQCDSQHCRADQPAGVERCHRGGPGR